MKRTLAATIILCLMLSAQLQAYAAAGWPTYTVGSNVPAEVGETVTVPITVSNNPGFTAVGFVVTYNTSVLEITGVSSATASMPLNSQFALTSTPGSQWIHLFNTNLVDWSGNGTVVNIDFKVKSTAPLGVSPVYLSFTSVPDGTPANAGGSILSDARVVSGSVEVNDTDAGSTKYPVVYHLNGGTGATPVETDKSAGQKFQATSATGITAPYGKQFKEWNTSPDGTGIWYWPGETITMPDSALMLYAIWETVAIPNNTDAENSDMGVVYVLDDAGNSVSSEWIPQTGLLFWPIPLLTSIGCLLLFPCCVLLNKKKR